MNRSAMVTVLRVALLWAAGITVAFPLVWVALASVKTPAQLNEPFLVAFAPSFASWHEVLASGILGAAGRSALVALVTVGISVVVGSMGAYAIARYRAGGTLTRFGMLAAQVLPPAVLVFPFLTMAYALRLTDTLLPVIFSHLSFVLPVVTWFLIGFFEAVPRSLEEQAQVDGFGRFAAFRLVVLPQVLPASVPRRSSVSPCRGTTCSTGSSWRRVRRPSCRWPSQVSTRSAEYRSAP